MTAPQTRHLGPAGLAVRLVGTAVALGILVVGQVEDTNDLFPFGSLSQYATARDMDGHVRSIYLLGDTDTEQGRFISSNMHTIGVGRADIESQLPLILEDPSMMQAFIDSYAALNPHRPPIRTLYLMRVVQPLENGYVSGEPVRTELLRWESTTPGDGAG